MSDVSLFEQRLKKFIELDTSGKFVSVGDDLKEFDTQCQAASVDVDQILAELLIPNPAKLDSDAKLDKNDRIQSYLQSLDPNPHVVSGVPVTFNRSAYRHEKIAWVKAHLSMGEKIAILSEVQAFESIIDGTNPYPKDVADARRAKSESKSDCNRRAKQLQADFDSLLADIQKEIDSTENEIKVKEQRIFELSQGKAGEKSKATVTGKASELIDALTTQLDPLRTKLASLEQLLNNAKSNAHLFTDALNKSLRDNKLFEKDEAKKDDKSDEKDSGSSIKSPYSSLSDRGKQASDSEEAKELYQSFAAASSYNKFLMLTGLDAHNMLEIARNLSKVGDRKDLQEYCLKMIDSKFIKYDKAGATLEGFTITVNKGRPNEQKIVFPSISKTKLKEGLLDKDADDIRKLFETFYTIKLQNLSMKDLEKLQNYSNALLVSSTLQEAKWGMGKQITKGFFKLAGRKKDPHYDLGNDVASFLRPIAERKDKIFKDINKEVDKGIDSADFIKYGQSTAVQRGQRKFQVRSFDHEK